jgi:hypothetical protein
MSVTNVVRSQYSTEQTTRASWRGLCLNTKNGQAIELLHDLSGRISKAQRRGRPSK